MRRDLTLPEGSSDFGHDESRHVRHLCLEGRDSGRYIPYGEVSLEKTVLGDHAVGTEVVIQVFVVVGISWDRQDRETRSDRS